MLTTNIILPSQLNVVKEEGHKGSYEIEGLYPGYGHTLGNSLRRIILSSLPGVAITSVKVKGADHEFATLEGVKEDVITMILNLKNVRFNMATDEPQTAKISVKGSKTVTAADIETPGGLEVTTPDLHIAEVTDSKTTLDIELVVEKGLGFVTKENMHDDKVNIGVIRVDAVFTPIRKVNYDVDNMRVGDRTDFNRLRINIETDGSLTAREALEDAIKIMLSQMRAILDLQEEDLVAPKEEVAEEAPVADTSSDDSENDEEQEEDMTDALKTRIDSIDFSTRTANSLAEANIRTLGGLVRKTESDLLDLDGIGDKGIEEIKSMLDTYGLALKQ